MGRSINPFTTRGDFTLNMQGKSQVIPLNMQDESQVIPVKFDSIYTSGGGSAGGGVITLTGMSGVLNDTQKAVIMKSINAVIIREDNYYRIQSKSSTELVYMSELIDVNAQDTIRISLPEYAWVYEKIENQTVEEHIADSDLHVQAGERDFWNNKLNYTMDGDEHLVFNRD